MIKPLHDRVIIERTEKEEKTKGGIIIPETAKEKPVRGKVIAVGEGRRMQDGTLVPLSVKPGDMVLFGRYGGQEVKIDDKELLIMSEDEILGIIE